MLPVSAWSGIPPTMSVSDSPGSLRHPVTDQTLYQQVDETDALLDGSHHAQYGGTGGDDVVQPDEDELRREREALERITAQAAECVRC